jgi:SAM-dependent methyltransferase
MKHVLKRLSLTAELSARRKAKRQAKLGSRPIDEIYAAMRNSEMVSLVGLGDPADIGARNLSSILENLPVARNHAVLDFGCGIGRTSALLAEFLSNGRVVGIDMVPGHIQFCYEEITSRFPNATFYCNRADNLLYDHWVDVTESRFARTADDDFFAAHRENFDTVVAFSVFTHFNPQMAAQYLRKLRSATKPWGYLFLTWFLDHPENPSASKLNDGEDFRDCDGNLTLALFSVSSMVALAAEAGLRVERISYGHWRGWPPSAATGQHYQDAVIFRRYVEVPADFDPVIYLRLHKDVAAARLDPIEHYLSFGHTEGRQYR